MSGHGVEEPIWISFRGGRTMGVQLFEGIPSQSAQVKARPHEAFAASTMRVTSSSGTA